MTRLTVSILVHTLEQALAAAARAAEAGADLVEFRIDLFADNAARVIELVNRSALPCIITCRPTWEGGQYDGDEQARISLLEHVGLGETGGASGGRRPAYIDVELAAYQSSANLRQKIGLVVDHPGQVRPTDTGLILSSHDFKTRPADLYQRIEAMVAAPACRIVKVAWKARSLRDNLEAFDILRQKHKPAIALCMGEEGLASRVLAKKFGAFLTFAALDAGSGTAPGQPTVDQLKRLYRWDRIGPATRVYGVIGHPVGHSMSPAVHNAGFDAAGHDGVYLPMPIPPEYEHFKATVGSWVDTEGLHFRGASVTIPHKENLIRFVKDRGGMIEPLCESIGAANTLHVRDDGSLLAFNTDFAAALDAVCDAIRINRGDLRGKRVAVIGAGGAARAVVAGFASYGATVVIYNRTMEKAQALAAQFDGKNVRAAFGGGKVVAARLDKLCDSCCEIFINCTPIGMYPNINETPIPVTEMKSWGPETVVFDTIYNPIETRLLREAKAAGCVTVSGVDMFVYQAKEQFWEWTHAEAPLEVFRAVLAKKLARG
ncbi:MAG: shikimate dehydrogenase [Planctomycetes bacterium]|nr:shikimate dehydrogenase [Planctomycetota bacterium]